jgi:hypothetical protein
MNDLAEMARIASSYTARLSPEQVRLSRVGRFIWLRLDVNRDARSNARAKIRSNTTNLVFRLPTDSASAIPFTRPGRGLAAPQMT